MNKLDLRLLDIKTLTEQDVLDYCQLNSININKITYLDLGYNELTDISGIKLFKNLKTLYLECNKNKLKDISVIQYLNKLKKLSIINLNLESDQIKYLKNIKILYCREGFKDMTVLKQLNNIQKYY